MGRAMGAISGGEGGNRLKNVAIGAGLQVFEASTLGQPFEVIKTHMAGNVKYFAIIFLHNSI